MGKFFFKKIIVAINGRQSSLHAAMYAIMMGKTYNLSVKFVYVVDTATIKYLAMNKLIVADSKSSIEEKLKADGENYLHFAENLASSKGLKVEKELRSGGVFTEIIKCAEEYEADLILLGGNENRNSIKHNVLSPDQNEVLANAGCPVMIIQKSDIEKIFKAF